MTRLVALAATLVLNCLNLAACGPPGQVNEDAATAARVVTLAPHLTELVFAAGAGDTLVGVSAYSDHPPEAASLEVVSDAFTVDQERLALLAPDLVLAWQSGTPAHVVDELRELGYRVAVIRTRGLADISRALLELGELTGRRARAAGVANEFDAALAALAERYSAKPAVRVFYQVSARPLYTINGEHYIGEIMQLCGGRNIFDDLNELAPAVTVESVVDRNPEALFAGSADGEHPFEEWQRWPHIDANRYGNHFVVDSDEIGRPSTRLVSAVQAVCEQLELARANRRATGATPAKKGS